MLWWNILPTSVQATCVHNCRLLHGSWVPLWIVRRYVFLLAILLAVQKYVLVLLFAMLALEDCFCWGKRCDKVYAG